MQETGKRQYAMKKAYEISYAMFRVGSVMANQSLRDHLERQALSLLDAIAVENYAWAGMASRAMEYLVKFGSDVGIMNGQNADTLIGQLNEMNAAIAESGKPAKSEPAMVSLKGIFTHEQPLFTEKKKQEGRQGKPEAATLEGSETRQTAILERIRQSGNCRLKDIQELLPDLSERTLRYDLQSLVERNSIERVGNGGPAVFYRIRQAV